jgi:hypothetical protein
MALPEEVAVVSDLLQITEPVLNDESIESFEYVAYSVPDTQQLNRTNDLSIKIPGGDEYLCPSKSYLHFEGRLTPADDTVYAAGDRVTLVNNAMAFLFSQIRYFISDNEVEAISSPGQATTMKGLLSYNNDFAKAEGLGLCWTKDTSPDTVLANNLGFAARQSLIVAKPDPRGSFAFCVPLDHLFGFCQDYRKVIYGVNHRIALTRQSDTDAIYREDTVKAGKITLTNISWHMPKVVPSLMVKNDFGKLIQSKSRLSVAYRSLQCESRAMPAAKTDTWDLVSKSGTERPRWLLVAFQTGKAENQTRNPAVFDNVRLTKIHATVNGRRYPDADMTSDFPSYSFAQLYNAMKQFKPEYYGVPGMESTNSITPVEFCELYPIHVIDLRRQPEKLKDVSLDIKIKTTFSANVPAGTLGYAVLISDRKFFLESDGSNFRMVTN